MLVLRSLSSLYWILWSNNTSSIWLSNLKSSGHSPSPRGQPSFMPISSWKFVFLFSYYDVKLNSRKINLHFCKNPTFHSHLSIFIKVTRFKTFHIYLAFLTSKNIQLLPMILYRKNSNTVWYISNLHFGGCSGKLPCAFLMGINDWRQQDQKCKRTHKKQR